MGNSADTMAGIANNLAYAREMRLYGEIHDSVRAYSRAVYELMQWLRDEDIETLLAAWEGSMAQHPMELEEWREFLTERGLMLAAELAVDAYCDALEEQVCHWRGSVMERSPDIWIDPDVGSDLFKAAEGSGEYVWPELDISGNIKRWQKQVQLYLGGKPLASTAMAMTEEQQREKMGKISEDINTRFADVFRAMARDAAIHSDRIKPQERLEG